MERNSVLTGVWKECCWVNWGTSETSLEGLTKVSQKSGLLFLAEEQLHSCTNQHWRLVSKNSWFIYLFIYFYQRLLFEKKKHAGARRDRSRRDLLLVLNYQPAVNYKSHSTAGGSLLPLALAKSRPQMWEPWSSGGPVRTRPSVTHCDTCHKIIVLPSIRGPNHHHSRWRPSRKTGGRALSLSPTQSAHGRSKQGHNYRGAPDLKLDLPWIHLWIES